MLSSPFLLVEFVTDLFRSHEVPARSDPFDVASRSLGRLRLDALLALVDLGAVGVFDEGEGGAITIVGLDTEQGV
jgi:hypothetical protein